MVGGQQGADARRAGVLPNEIHKARRKSRAVRFQQIEEDLLQRSFDDDLAPFVVMLAGARVCVCDAVWR